MHMNYRHFVPVIGAFLVAMAIALPVASFAHEKHPGERAFAAGVAKRHKVSKQAILTALNQAERKQSIIDAMQRPAESKPWPAYRALFMTPLRIGGGIVFYRANHALLERIADQYGVDPQYIVAILGVETNYGTHTGQYRVLDALTTLAFHYPPRAKYFRGELEKFLTMPASQLPGPLLDIKGSYAGAMGWGQFMPTSVAAYARDEDGDGHIDLVGSLPDILASVANYLARHGWQRGQPVAIGADAAPGAKTVKRARSKPLYTVGALQAHGYAPTKKVAADTPATVLSLEADSDGTQQRYWFTFNNFYVITRYNRSPLYAMAVTELAQAIAKGSTDPADPAGAAGIAADTNAAKRVAGKSR